MNTKNGINIIYEHFKTTWSIVTVVIGATIWLTTQLELPRERKLRTAGFINKFNELTIAVKEVDSSIEQHIIGPGHPLTNQRLDTLSKTLDELRQFEIDIAKERQQQLAEIVDELRKIKNN